MKKYFIALTLLSLASNYTYADVEHCKGALIDISGVINTPNKGKTSIIQDGFKVRYIAVDDCCSYTFDGRFIDPQTVEGIQQRIARDFQGGPCRIDSNIKIIAHSTRNITVYETFIDKSHPQNNTCGITNFNPLPVTYQY